MEVEIRICLRDRDVRCSVEMGGGGIVELHTDGAHRAADYRWVG